MAAFRHHHTQVTRAASTSVGPKSYGQESACTTCTVASPAILHACRVNGACYSCFLLIVSLCARQTSSGIGRNRLKTPLARACAYSFLEQSKAASIVGLAELPALPFNPFYLLCMCVCIRSGAAFSGNCLPNAWYVAPGRQTAFAPFASKRMHSCGRGAAVAPCCCRSQCPQKRPRARLCAQIACGNHPTA